MILACGVFDGLHGGHISYLHQAAYLCTQPITVAMAPDAYIRTVKGREPFYPLEERVAAVAKVWGVDAVVIHSDEGVQDILRDQPVRVFVKGMDCYGKLTPEVVDICKRKRIAMAFVESGSDRHTSQR